MASPKTVFLSIAIAATLAGCGRSESPVPAATPATDPAAAPAPATPSATPSTFASAAADAAPPSGGHCALDAIDTAAPGAVALSAGGDATFVGWVTDGALQVPTGAELVLSAPGARFTAALAVGGPRDDVAAALGGGATATAGFDQRASLAAVTPGRYAVSVAFAGAMPGECATGREIEVAAP